MLCFEDLKCLNNQAHIQEVNLLLDYVLRGRDITPKWVKIGFGGAEKKSYSFLCMNILFTMVLKLHKEDLGKMSIKASGVGGCSDEKLSEKHWIQAFSSENLCYYVSRNNTESND